jgi:hypothetical protein
MYERLAKLAGSVGVDERAILPMLWVSDKPGENGVLNVSLLLPLVFKDRLEIKD